MQTAPIYSFFALKINRRGVLLSFLQGTPSLHPRRGFESVFYVENKSQRCVAQFFARPWIVLRGSCPGLACVGQKRFSARHAKPASLSWLRVRRKPKVLHPCPVRCQTFGLRRAWLHVQNFGVLAPGASAARKDIDNHARDRGARGQEALQRVFVGLHLRRTTVLAICFSKAWPRIKIHVIWLIFVGLFRNFWTKLMSILSKVN